MQENKKLYSIGAKVFLLGEYAVLGLLPAVIASIPPRFTMWAEEGDPQRILEGVSPNSPLDRLITWARSQNLPAVRFPLRFHFNDPFQGKGGFGASTAQFALAYLLTNPNQLSAFHWKPVWDLYRKLMSDSPVPPSGADLVAQWRGGVTFFDPSDGYCQDVWPLFDWSNLLIFSATSQQGRKVNTHEHLSVLSPNQFSFLEKPLVQGIKAIQENNPIRLGQCMNEYAEQLFHHQFEIAATTEDRRVFGKMPGVLGVKGAGAMQSDAVLVLTEPRSIHRDEIIRVARDRGLDLLCDGLTCQMGVSCQTL